MYLESYGDRNILFILNGCVEKFIARIFKNIKFYEILFVGKYLMKMLVFYIKKNGGVVVNINEIYRV